MARMKQGVFSWEDVLVQRYQSKYLLFLFPTYFYFLLGIQI